MAEVAGLALAILPLLISTAEHYKTCLRPIERYIHFVSRVESFQSALSIQKTTFRNQCRILLGLAVEHDVAAGMLQNTQHPSWRDADIEFDIVKRLEDSKDACILVISKIQFILKSLTAWSADLASAIQKNDKVRIITI